MDETNKMDFGKVFYLTKIPFENIFFNNFTHFLHSFCREEIEPIGNGEGPQYNPNGTADVTADLHNNHLSYSITAEDFVREKEKNKKNKTVINEYDE